MTRTHDHDVALAEVAAAAAGALEAARRLAAFVETPWASSVLFAAERLVKDVGWYATDLEQRRADEHARQKENRRD
jgi:hypothetical protein